MPINRDLSGVPRRTEAGLPPSKHPFAVTALAEKFYEQYVNTGAALAIPEAGNYRASYTSKRCDRQLYYALAGVEPSNPVTIADIWRFALGELVHTALQSARGAAHPEALHEPHVDLRPLGIDGSGHVDVLDGDLLIELKSINGFSFKMTSTSMKGPPQGPRYGAVVQAALLAAGINAAGHVLVPEVNKDGEVELHQVDVEEIKRIVVGYLSLELVGPGMVDVIVNDDDDFGREVARFTAEWHFTMDELQPIAEYEVGRIRRIKHMVERQQIPVRALHDPEYPAGAVIASPKVKSAPWQLVDGDVVEDSGTTWFCGYCPHIDQCVADGPGSPGEDIEI